MVDEGKRTLNAYWNKGRNEENMKFLEIPKYWTDLSLQLETKRRNLKSKILPKAAILMETDKRNT